jgi:hypothetical protein
VDDIPHHLSRVFYGGNIRRVTEALLRECDRAHVIRIGMSARGTMILPIIMIVSRATSRRSTLAACRLIMLMRVHPRVRLRAPAQNREREEPERSQSRRNDAGGPMNTLQLFSKATHSRRD